MQFQVTAEHRRSFLPSFLAMIVVGIAAGVAGTMFVLPYATSILIDKSGVGATSVGVITRRPEQSVAIDRLSSAARAAVSFAAPKVAGADLLASSYIPGDAIGLGIVVTSDGWLATAEDASVPKKRRLEDSVALVAGKAYKVDRVVRDAFSGVAFVKVTAENLPVAAFGTAADVVPGDVLYGLDAAGELHRADVLANDTLPAALAADALRSSEQAQRAIRTAVSVGLPGGMMINGKGEIIGLRVRDAAFGTVVIPIESFSDVIGAVLRGQASQRPYLGIHYVDLSLLSARTDDGPMRGAQVTSSTDGRTLGIVRGSPAALAGIRLGDVITAIDGEQISAKNPLAEALAQYLPGDEVALTLQRGKAPSTIDIKLKLGTAPAK